MLCVLDAETAQIASKTEQTTSQAPDTTVEADDVISDATSTSSFDTVIHLSDADSDDQQHIGNGYNTFFCIYCVYSIRIVQVLV